jgi:hypothetical protein
MGMGLRHRLRTSSEPVDTHFLAWLILACPCLPGALLSHNPLLLSISPLSRPQTRKGAGAPLLPSQKGSQRALTAFNVSRDGVWR